MIFQVWHYVLDYPPAQTECQLDLKALHQFVGHSELQLHRGQLGGLLAMMRKVHQLVGFQLYPPTPLL